MSRKKTQTKALSDEQLLKMLDEMENEDSSRKRVINVTYIITNDAYTRRRRSMCYEIFSIYMEHF